jgi:hypothetical protein
VPRTWLIRSPDSRTELPEVRVSASVQMKAVVQHSFGAPAVLTLREAARPIPLPTEVLVRVRAAG